MSADKFFLSKMKLVSKRRRSIILSAVGGLILIFLTLVVIYSVGFLKNFAESFLQDAGSQQKQAIRYDFEKLKKLDLIKEPRQ